MLIVLMTPSVLGALLYLAVLSTAAAWYLWYNGLEYVDAGTVAVFFLSNRWLGLFLAHPR